MWACLASRRPIMLGLEPSLISKPRQFSDGIPSSNLPVPDTGSADACSHGW